MHSYRKTVCTFEMEPDYSLYLVTDNTPAILGGRDLVSIVEDAVRGGTATPYKTLHIPLDV